jgi:hypothetical protein
LLFNTDAMVASLSSSVGRKAFAEPVQPVAFIVFVLFVGHMKLMGA